MFETMKLKAGVAAICLALAGAYACGDDDSKDGGSNNASADTSSFDVNVTTDSGTEPHKAKQDDSQAGQNSWGATITGPNLHMMLLSPDGTMINVIVETSEDAKAPGKFGFSDGTSDTLVTLMNPAAGNVFESATTGTITLENCPRTVGEHVRGSFDGIELEGQAGGNATYTLNGSFDVVVYAKAGDLFCEKPAGNNEPGNNDPGNNDPGNNNPGNNNPQVCEADRCMTGGVCCPYISCVSQCETQCIMSAECAGGMNPAACAQCAMECLDSCGVSEECRSAYVELNTCNNTHSCDEVEDQDQCLEANCCSELNAAL